MNFASGGTGPMIKTGNSLYDSLIELSLCLGLILLLNRFLVPPLSSLITWILATKYLKQDFSFREIWAMVKKGWRPVFILDAFEKANKAKVYVDFNYLKKTFENDKGDSAGITGLVEGLVAAKEKGIRLTFTDVQKYSISPADVKPFVEALTLAEKLGIDLTIGELLENRALSDAVFCFDEGADTVPGLTFPQLKQHVLNGGNPDEVVTSLIWANQSEIKLTFEDACRIDLETGRLLEITEKAEEMNLTEIKPETAGRLM